MSIRALWGATTIAVWVNVLIGVIRSNLDYMYVGLISLMLVFLGRFVRVQVDGAFPELVPNLIPTAIATALVLIAYKLMTNPTELSHSESLEQY